eukprot:TRINITY_DN29840_c0_g1_i2.p1 TRINITY_DN29840_c0_g1~~TRINITY_DN29840_c0_g1_i2.p1  ORF type:complete len:112 (+),score=27.16 TRINITY_DN29840_c0_g1_i2:333-668(+)
MVWTQLVPHSNIVPPPRAGTARVVGNRLIVFGGDQLCDEEQEREVLDDTWIGCFGKDSIKWSEMSYPKETGPSARYGYSSNVVDGSIVLFGGVSASENFMGDTFILSLWGL